MVTAFTRSPKKVENTHKNLFIAQGDIVDTAAVEEAVSGQEAVICVLGDGEKGKIRSVGTRHIVQAMEKKGIRRLICESALGVGDSRENLNDEWKNIVSGPLREAYKDHAEQEALIQQSDLDWTIVRAAAFTDGEHTDNYRHGFSPDDKTLKLEISRADVADFLLKQLSNDQYLYKTPGLSY